MEDRVQKILAMSGLGSRRFCESLILQGRVCVNGKRVDVLGRKADVETDKIEVDGCMVSPGVEYVYLALNKPEGYVCTTKDEFGRNTIYSLTKKVNKRLFSIGRLDMNSKGLILLTNDGFISNKLMHPSQSVQKVYVVKITGDLSAESIRALRKGVMLDEGVAAFDKIRALHKNKEDTSTYEIRMHQGRKRQIRRMLSVFGKDVLELQRIRFGPVALKDLTEGDWRYLNPYEVSELYKSVGMEG